MQHELSTDMDRLTQLQDAIEDLFTITSSTISYLSTSINFKPLHPDLPVTFRSTSADPMVVFNENKQELLADLVRKAKQVEYLITVLPEQTTEESHVERLSKLDEEVKQVNEEYKQVVLQAESLLKELEQTLAKVL